MQAPSLAESTPTDLLKTLNGLPREIRDYIYELTFDEEVLVFGRRGLLPEDREGTCHPEKTSPVATKYRLVYPGTHSPFGTQDSDDFSKNAPQTADNEDDQVNDPQQAEMTAYGSSVRKSLRMYDAPVSGSQEAVSRKTCLSRILLTSKQNYEEAASYLYKSCTFLFEDFELSTKFLTTTSFENLKHITKIAVYYPQEAEGTVKAITAIRACPDLSSFYEQSNAFHHDAESRLRRALVSFHANPADNYALAFNIGTQGSTFYQDVDDPNILASVHSSLFPSRWLFGVMCRLIVVSMPVVKELTVWIGNTLELEFNSRRDEIYEAALLQFVAMGNVDALSVKKWGEVFDNTGGMRMLVGTRSTGWKLALSTAWRR